MGISIQDHDGFFEVAGIDRMDLFVPVDTVVAAAEDQ